jgi:hypothetical protein
MRPKRDTARPQAPLPSWKAQVERNAFRRRCGWWHKAYEAQRDDPSRARWRQFFGWPPPLDTARLSEIFAGVYRGEIADVVDSNALLRFLR